MSLEITLSNSIVELFIDSHKIAWVIWKGEWGLIGVGG